MMPIPNDPPERDRECPHCGSSTPKFDEVFGYYSCRDCTHCWPHRQDAPDWEDYVDDVQLLDHAYHTDPEYWAKLIERRLD